MTPNEIRIAIAECCGWKWYRRPAVGPWANKPMRSLYHPEIMKLQESPLELADGLERECNPEFIWREGLVPDYPNDLNAMHEAEKTLNDHQLVEYAKQLAVTSTAPQRSEAFLRTLGKWKE